MSNIRYAVAANSLQDNYVSEWFDDYSAAVAKLKEMGAETHYIMDTESLEESRNTSQRARDLLALAFPAAVEPATREYTFDLNLKASVTVKAAFAREALRMVQEAFECADCNGGAWQDGSPILFEASLSQRPDIGMIDGQNVNVSTLRDYNTLFYNEES